MKWHILDTGKASAQKNMSIDEGLLNTLRPTDTPILHLYDWEGDCATFGYFIDPASFLNLEKLEQRNLQIARRPTGGGVVFHFCDYAFSVLIPAGHPNFSLNTMENYAFVNKLVQKVVAQFISQNITSELLPEESPPWDESSRHFCMAKPTKYDVMVNGRKVGGASQRRTKSGFLHQGTISLKIPDDSILEEILKPDTCVKAAMKHHSYPLLAPDDDLQEARSMIRQELIALLKS